MSFSSDNPLVTNQVPQTVTLPSLQEERQFIGKLEDYLKDHAETLNSKEGGLYALTENYTSQQYFISNKTFSYRNVYRKVIDFVKENGGVNIAGSAVNVTFPHGITSPVESALIYANCTTDTTEMFSTMGPTVFIDGTDAHFTNPSASPLTQCDFIINILKTTG